MEDATIPVVEPVDCGVVLVVAAQRSQQKLPGFKMDRLDRRNGKIRVTGRGRVLIVPRSIRQVEPSTSAKLAVHIVGTLNYSSNQVANPVIVCPQIQPVPFASICQPSY